MTKIKKDKKKNSDQWYFKQNIMIKIKHLEKFNH